MMKCACKRDKHESRSQMRYYAYDFPNKQTVTFKQKNKCARIKTKIEIYRTISYLIAYYDIKKSNNRTESGLIETLCKICLFSLFFPFKNIHPLCIYICDKVFFYNTMSCEYKHMHRFNCTLFNTQDLETSRQNFIMLMRLPAM